MSLQSRVTPDRAVLVGLFLTAAIYCRDLRYDFILDDVPLILMNETITSWHNWKIVFMTDAFFVKGVSVPMAMAAVHYRPIFVLWLMLNQQLFGSVLPWWHLTSLLLHLGVIFLVYKLGQKVVKSSWTAALAALLFAFHPIHLESVSYVSASTDLLVTLFLLISFLCYSQFREQGASPAYLAAAAFTAALAILSKETAVMFPWMLVAYEALREIPPGTSRRWKQFIWTLPFFAVVGIYVLVRTLLFGHNLGPGPGGNRWAALVDAPLVLIAYFRNLLWSSRLSFFYPVEWGSRWTLLKGSGVVLSIAIVVLLWNHYRDQPRVRLQLVWTGILFVLPVMAVFTFVKEDWIHDRHMYLVSVPVCLIVAALLTDPKLPRKASVVISSLILLLLLFEATVQVSRFSDGISIYESALKVAPSNALAHRYYALALNGYGRNDEAFREYRITADLWPGDPTICGGYADALAEVGRNEEAAAEYVEALRRNAKPTPYRAYLLYRLGTIEVKKSEPQEGEVHLREALQIAPPTLSYHGMLATALRQQGRLQEADAETHLEDGVRKTFLREHPR